MAIHVSVGTPTADSYITVGAANTYFLTRENSDPWTSILTNSTGTLSATTRKENLLKQAAREIDYEYRFHGQKYTDTFFGASDYQNLEFPRNDTIDDNGDPYIPDEIKYAQCEQALWILSRGGMRATNDGQVIEPKKIGPDVDTYLKRWKSARVMAYGSPPWAGSKY